MTELIFHYNINNNKHEREKKASSDFIILKKKNYQFEIKYLYW
jgi:hypothetical protein